MVDRNVINNIISIYTWTLLRVASKELYATGETKECLKAQQVPCPYRANEKPPAKLVDIYYAFTACANSAACFFIRSSSNWSICAISEDLNCSAFAMPTK